MSAIIVPCEYNDIHTLHNHMIINLFALDTDKISDNILMKTKHIHYAMW
jgi:hypothetical protein